MYSDLTEYDEWVVRNLTRASERYNSKECIIIVANHPSTPGEVADDVPDQLAYSVCYSVVADFAANTRANMALRTIARTALARLSASKKEIALCYLPITGMWKFDVLLPGLFGAKCDEPKTALFWISQTDSKGTAPHRF